METNGLIIGDYMPIHMGHVNALMKASYMCDNLYIVLIYNNEKEKKWCEEDNFKYIVPEVRTRWITQLTKDLENINILTVEEVVFKNKNTDASATIDNVIKKVGVHIDMLFHSNIYYAKQIKKRFPKIEVLIDEYDLKKFSVSSKQIRKNGIIKYWDDLPRIVRQYFVKKVVIVGTESSGKSTLTRHLAKLYNTNYVEEFGRTLCEDLGGYEGIFTPDLFPYIAYGHKMSEFESIKNSNKVLFIDTEIIVTQYFSELHSGRHIILDIIAQENEYDLWIYLEPDIEWVEDGFRTYGNDESRVKNNIKLKKMLDARNIKYEIVSGSYIERIRKAIKLVDDLLGI